MRIPRLVAVAFAALTVSAMAAQAAPGFSTANVNIRTGPDVDFPSVGVIPRANRSPSRAACAMSPGATSAGTAAAAGSTANISPSTIAAKWCRCLTSGLPTSAFPSSPSRPATTGIATTSDGRGTATGPAGTRSSRVRASAGMPRRRDRAAPAGGARATTLLPAWVRLPAVAGAVPITVAGMIAVTTGETIGMTVGTIGATTAAVTTGAAIGAIGADPIGRARM